MSLTNPFGNKTWLSGAYDAWKSIDPTKVGSADYSGLEGSIRDQQAYRESLQAAQTGYSGRQAPQIGQATMIDRGGVRNATSRDVASYHTPQVVAGQIWDPRQAQARAAQMNAMSMTEQAALGQVPSAAEGQLQRSLEQNARQQMAQALARGGFNPAAVRGAMYAAGEQGQELASQGAALRAQEQAAARQQLAEQAMGLRSSDFGLAAQQAQNSLAAQQFNEEMRTKMLVADADRALQAQLANQGVDLEVVKANAAAGNAMAMANLEAQLKTMGMNDAMVATYLSAITGVNQQILQAQMQKVQSESARYAESAKLRNQWLTGGISALGDVFSSWGSRQGGQPTVGQDQNPRGNPAADGGPQSDADPSWGTYPTYPVDQRESDLPAEGY